MDGLAHWLYINTTGNLVASAIWGIPAGIAFLRHHLHVRRRLAGLHAKVDALLAEDAAVPVETAGERISRYLSQGNPAREEGDV